MKSILEDLEPKDLMYLCIGGYFVVKTWSVVKKTRRGITLMKKASNTLDQVATDAKFLKIIETYGTEN